MNLQISKLVDYEVISNPSTKKKLVLLSYFFMFVSVASIVSFFKIIKSQDLLHSLLVGTLLFTLALSVVLAYLSRGFLITIFGFTIFMFSIGLFHPNGGGFICPDCSSNLYSLDSNEIKSISANHNTSYKSVDTLLRGDV